MDLRKSPSISETLDWAKALVTLNARQLDQQTLETTLSVLLKHESDLQRVEGELTRTEPDIESRPPRRPRLDDDDDFARYRRNN
jgi:predicted component of type VI protein secretion system